jgi:hypothetical protein
VRKLLVFALISGLTVFMAWVVLGSWFPSSKLTSGLVICLFMASPLGSIWMLRDFFLRTKQSYIDIVFAFVPYGFLWYYFERVRPREARISANS